MTDPERHDALLATVRDGLRPLERRTLIKGAALVAVAAAATQPGCAVPPASRRGAMPHASDLEAAVFERLVPVLLPLVPGTILVPPLRVPVLENVDAFLARIPADVRGDLATAIKLFAYGSILMGLRLQTFPALDDAAATDYCLAWQSGGAIRRGTMRALAQIVYVSYWREESTWVPLQYAGPVTRPFGIARQGNSPRPDAA